MTSKQEVAAAVLGWIDLRCYPNDEHTMTEYDLEAIRTAVATLNQQSATLALLHDLRRYLHDSTGSSLELDTRREKLHGMVVDRIREMEGDSNG